MSDNDIHPYRKKEIHGAEPTKPELQFAPAVDIYETEEAVTMLAEMPGVNKEGVDISLEDSVLTIKGTIQAPGPSNRTCLLKEYESGQFFRTFTISETIDQGKITAVMNNGILTLTLPKLTPMAPKKIEVQAG